VQRRHRYPEDKGAKKKQVAQRSQVHNKLRTKYIEESGAQRKHAQRHGARR
jgi:hypothetical protein